MGFVYSAVFRFTGAGETKTVSNEMKGMKQFLEARLERDHIRFLVRETTTFVGNTVDAIHSESTWSVDHSLPADVWTFEDVDDGRKWVPDPEIGAVLGPAARAVARGELMGDHACCVVLELLAQLEAGDARGPEPWLQEWFPKLYKRLYDQLEKRRTKKVEEVMSG